MKRILNLTVLTLTAFILLGTVSVMATERPFALNARGVATFITDAAGNPIRTDVSSSGTATHLGLVTTVGTINFSPDPPNPGRLLTSGSGTMTGANGDTVQLELNGGLEPTRAVLRLLINLSFASAAAQADLPGRTARAMA